MNRPGRAPEDEPKKNRSGSALAPDATQQNAAGERGFRNTGQMQNDPLTSVVQNAGKAVHSLGAPHLLGLDEFPALRGQRNRGAKHSRGLVVPRGQGRPRALRPNQGKWAWSDGMNDLTPDDRVSSDRGVRERVAAR